MDNVDMIVFVQKFVRDRFIHKYFLETILRHFHPFCIFYTQFIWYHVMYQAYFVSCFRLHTGRLCIQSNKQVNAILSVNYLFLSALSMRACTLFSRSAHDLSPKYVIHAYIEFSCTEAIKERTQSGFCFVRCSCRTKIKHFPLSVAKILIL